MILYLPFIFVLAGHLDRRKETSRSERTCSHEEWMYGVSEMFIFHSIEGFTSGVLQGSDARPIGGGMYRWERPCRTTTKHGWIFTFGGETVTYMITKLLVSVSEDI